MAHVTVADLQPVFEKVAESITPDQPAVDCPIATATYWAIRIDGEVGNGGIAQLIWNLHDQYEPRVLRDALVAVGASEAAELLDAAFTYINETPTRRKRFFARPPFPQLRAIARWSWG